MSEGVKNEERIQRKLKSLYRLDFTRFHDNLFWPGLLAMLQDLQDRGDGCFHRWRVSCEERPPKVHSPKRQLGMQQRMQVKLRSTRWLVYPAMTCPLRLNRSTVSDSIFMDSRNSSRGVGCTTCGTGL